MRAVLVVLGVAGLSLVGCGGESDRWPEDTVAGSGDSEVTTKVGEGLPSCEGMRHLTLFTVDGVLVPAGELERWQAVEGHEMKTIPGAGELATAYHELGSEVVYIVAEAGDIELHGVPYAQAIEDWLDRNGFPTGDRVTLLLEAGPQRVLQEMLSATVSGGSIQGAYVSDRDLVTPLISGGAPPNQIYLVGDHAPAADVSTIPETGLLDRVPQVREEVKPLCKES